MRPDAPAPGALQLRAAIAVYPDCALVDTPRPMVRVPLFMAMAERDDWTPVAQCTALLARIVEGRKLAESVIYPGAHHSFDAIGLSVRYLAAAGNRSKPGNCCGAHYGYHEPAWLQFRKDVEAFLTRQLGGAR
jgi:dienelactone hydrolase